MKNTTLVLFIISWVLTLTGNNVIIDWLGQLFVSFGANTESMPYLPIIGLGIQLFFAIIAGVLAYPALKDKSLKPMAIIAIAVNGLTIVHTLASFIYAVSSGQLTL